MKKIYLLTLVIIVSVMLFFNCSGDSSSNNTSSTSVEGKEVLSGPIFDFLKSGKKYKKFKTLSSWSFLHTWLKFEGSTVELIVKTTGKEDGVKRTYDKQNIVGKYTIHDNNGVYTIDCDFGKQNMTIKTQDSPIEYPIPLSLKIKMDSLNNVKIDGGWKLLIPKVSKDDASKDSEQD